MPKWAEWEPIRHQVAIGGMVTDAAGARVQHATVTVEAPEGPRPKRDDAARGAAGAAQVSSEPTERTETRSDGSFFFLDLPNGTYTVKAAHARLGTAEEKAVVTRNKNGKVEMASAVLKLVKQ